MRKRKIFFAAFAILALCLTQCASGTAWAELKKGNGTLTNPDTHRITSVNELRQLATEINGEDVNNPYWAHQNYVLDDDIDNIKGLDLTNETNWLPIGTVENPFRGIFDGNGKKIIGLRANRREKSVGLFGSTKGATIKSLGVVIHPDGVRGNTSDSYVGGLVGFQRNGTIKNCYVIGTTSGDVVSGDIRGNSSNSCVGGLVGFQSTEPEGGIDGKSSIENCYVGVGSNVRGGDDSYVGGLVGFQDTWGGTSSIENCYAAGNVSTRQSGKAGSAGGLIGYTLTNSSTSIIRNSYATGNVEGNYAGGLIGHTLAYSTSKSTIENSYATGDVNGDDANGLVGRKYADESTNTIKNCYRGVFVKVNGIEAPVNDPASIHGGTVTAKQLLTKGTYEGPDKDKKVWEFDTSSGWQWSETFSYPMLGTEETYLSYPFPCANIIGPDNLDDKDVGILVEGYYQREWNGNLKLLGAPVVSVDAANAYAYTMNNEGTKVQVPNSNVKDIFTWDYSRGKLNIAPGLKGGNTYFVELMAKNGTGEGGNTTFTLDVKAPAEIGSVESTSMVLAKDYEEDSNFVYISSGDAKVEKKIYVRVGRDKTKTEVTKENDVGNAYNNIVLDENKKMLTIKPGINAAQGPDDVDKGIGTYLIELVASNDWTTEPYPKLSLELQVIEKPTIKGRTSLTLTQGYGAWTSSEYEIGGINVSVECDVVEGEHEGRISYKDKKLSIEPGLQPNNYIVTLTANNDLTKIYPDYAYVLTFLLIVNAPPEAPKIERPGSWTSNSFVLPLGYEAISTGAFTITGTELIDVKPKVDNDPTERIIWNSNTRRVDILSGLKVGSYLVKLTANNELTTSDPIKYPPAEYEFTLVVAEPPTITGPEGPKPMTLAEDYIATSTEAFTITGTELIEVTLDNNYDGKITWNDTTKKLDIAAGLKGGEYPVKLTASNELTASYPTDPNMRGECEFLLVVTAPPTITGPTSMPLVEGYMVASTEAFTITGTEPVKVTLDNNHDGKITWNDTTKKLDIAAGLKEGNYDVVLTPSNIMGEGEKFTFTLTVTARPALVTSVTIDPPSTVEVKKGSTHTFTATVHSDDSDDGKHPVQDVTWMVDGNTSDETSISTDGVLTVAADETAGHLIVRATSVADPQKSGTAAVIVTTVDPENNATLDGQEIGLDKNANGEGWDWNSVSRTMTVTGDLIGGAAFTANYEIKINVTTNVTMGRIVNDGTGKLTITAGSGLGRASEASLIVETETGPAISAFGDIEISSGEVHATTRDESAPAIVSTNGSVIISGTASVTAEATGDGSAISAKEENINISTSEIVKAITDGAGYCLEAKAINITNGTTELSFIEGKGKAYSIDPAISGDDTKVSANDDQVYPKLVPPMITSLNHTTVTSGTAGTFQVTADGTQPITYELTGAPAGVNISSIGLITVPATLAAGGYPFTIIAFNEAGRGEQSFTLTVDAAPVGPVAPAIISENHTTVMSGTEDTFQVTANGSPTIEYRLAEVPAALTGISISSTGLITFPATVLAGTHNFKIIASNEAGEDEQRFTLTVSATPVAPTITSVNSTRVTSGTGGTFQVTATGNPSTFVYTLTGAPAGVSIGSSNGLITVAAAVAEGSHTFTIIASNGVDPDARQSFTLIVSAAPVGVAPTITSANSTTVTSGRVSTFQVTATGSPTITYSLTGAPAGVSIGSSNGLITVAATVAVGSYPFTITASNGVAPNATQSFTLTVTAGNVVVEDEGGSGSCNGFGAGMSMVWALFLLPLLATRKGKKAN